MTFLTPEQGGRADDAWDSPLYRPHLVVGDPNQRHALVNERGQGMEDYLGVQFTGNERRLPAGVEHLVTLALLYFPEVDYSSLVPGATFTVREGGKVVAFGRVIDGTWSPIHSA